MADDTVRLTYRPPFDWSAMLRFLGARMLKGVEWIAEDRYYRTVQLGEHTGWISVRHVPEEHALLVEVTPSLTPALPEVVGRLRHLFDLSARPDIIAATLTQDERLATVVRKNPGLRVPGAFDGFELAMRAILGQQITVKAATTLSGRLVDACGEECRTPHAALARLTPRAERIAATKVGELVSLGIIGMRARSIIAVAEAVASGQLRLEAGAPPDETMTRLTAMPGIGPWTAQYIAMRALRWPDAFPRGDLVLRRRLGGITAARAEALSQRWRPWRSYATVYLWQGGAVVRA
ncbi:MAG TPA: AlkA N-terminal domain-containing protein [Gemmatimonadaceae bacterium]|nr:AlkA N-terminal domain-containing protein [Gemmatimonadaceae bacterium]